MSSSRMITTASNQIRSKLTTTSHLARSSLPQIRHASSPTTAPYPLKQQQKPTPTNLPGSNLPNAQKYSPTTVKLVTGLAKLFGYHSQTSTAIRTTSDFYDRCAERGEIEAPFFYEECSLPPSFQTWFSITTLHIWLLTVRFRALPAPLGRTYIQELINHFFIDVELRIRGPYNVTQSKLIKGYMQDMLEQYRGSVTAYDEGLIAGDAVLAAAIWRNVFGAGWGGVGGVKGKRAPKRGEKPEVGPDPLVHQRKPLLVVDPVQAKKLKKDSKFSDVFTTDAPVVDPKLADALNLGQLQAEYNSLEPEDPELEFVQSLEKIVRYIRREAQRLERLPDDVVLHGRPMEGKGSLTGFGPILQ
ncbi:hypothetical protein T439DRAFT_321965 [Meredithblackwellia eburnea MCA 4105]